MFKILSSVFHSFSSTNISATEESSWCHGKPVKMSHVVEVHHVAERQNPGNKSWVHLQNQRMSVATFFAKLDKIIVIECILLTFNWGMAN